MQTRIRNLRNGAVTQKTFHTRDEVEEAEIEKRKAVFVYSHRGKYVFSEEGNPKNRFEIEENRIAEKTAYLKENTPVTVLFFEEEVISISLPVKMTFRVKEAPPGIRGDRSQGGTKTVILETGAPIEAPLFVKEDDVIEINTETGEYARRL